MRYYSLENISRRSRISSRMPGRVNISPLDFLSLV